MARTVGVVFACVASVPVPEISGREKEFSHSGRAENGALFFPRVLLAALYFVRLVREKERLLRRQESCRLVNPILHSLFQALGRGQARDKTRED